MIASCVALQLLKLHLLDAGIRVPLNVRIKHDRNCDRLNAKKPRQFCFVKQGGQTIHCAAALEVVPEVIRYAVLLHELGHIISNSFTQVTAEIDTDSWILKNVPESGYSYQDVLFDGVEVNSIQTVSPKFIMKLIERYEIFTENDQILVCNRRGKTDGVKA